MTDADDGFLSRWSRRKAQGRSGQAEPATLEHSKSQAAPASVVPTTENLLSTPVESAPIAQHMPARAEPVTQPVEPLPTMDDVAQLTSQSDFSRFVRPGVDSGVRNAAMKKLFSDPHFNVMDGLDTYIDDYGKPDPIPPSMLRRMTQSVALGLFDVDPPADERANPGNESAPLPVNPDGPLPSAVAQSADRPESATPPPPAEARPDDDPDLRLQQDDGAGRPGAAPEPGA